MRSAASPSEASIAEAIKALKAAPGEFQRVAEDYARLSFPNLFSHLVPKGRRPDAVTIRGWPDAYAELADGRIAALEATHSPAWPRHLHTDLTKNIASIEKGTLAAFIFVAWAPAPPPEKLESPRKRLLDHGVPPENIRFVFRQELTATLRQPRFARTCLDLLGLRSHARPFTLIEQARLYGMASDRWSFAPALEEYRINSVHRSALAEVVERKLRTSGWALVRGMGVSGKSVLAAQIGLAGAYAGGVAYYLNVADFDDELMGSVLSGALDTLVSRGDSQVLFVIDNIHLGEDFARQCLEHWRLSENGSALLLLGRHLSAETDARGTVGPLEDYNAEALVLEAGPNDLAGVLRRLAHRVADGQPVNEPRPPELDRWAAVFGGDLIAFSAAVRQRIHCLLRSDWRLEAADAVEHVRATYLAPADESERRNLAIMAACGELETDVADAALEAGGLPNALRHGLVHKHRAGKEGHLWWHLVHPGFGDLIRAAQGNDVSHFEALALASQRSGIMAAALVHRLLKRGEKARAKALLNLLAKNSGYVVSYVARSGLVAAATHVARVLDLEIITAETLDRILVDAQKILVASALRTPLGHLAAFLDYAEQRLPSWPRG